MNLSKLLMTLKPLIIYIHIYTLIIIILFNKEIIILLNVYKMNKLIIKLLGIPNIKNTLIEYYMNLI